MNMKDQLMMQARYSRGDFGNPDAGKSDFSREGIMAMSKDDLCEMLEVHGVAADKRKGRATLAAELIAIMFMETGE
jgi:hypothetical protein